MSAFGGVKVFSVTLAARRQALGEEVTRWLEDARKRPGFRLVDVVVTQSSDAEYHCISIGLFFKEESAATKKGKPHG